MQAPSSAVLARIYTDEDALYGDEALTTVILNRAREAKLAGATVLRATSGFGHSSRLHKHRPLGLGDNLPVVIEIVDDDGPLRAFVETLVEFQNIGLITFEKVEVVRYGSVTA